MRRALFTTNDLETEPADHSDDTGSVREKNKNHNSLGKSNSIVRDVIGTLQPDQSIHYASGGQWSSHDLLFHILDQTGPAKVWLCTWSISELAVRQIMEKLDAGIIQELHCIFDWRVKVRRPEALQLAQQIVTDVKLTTCHAKVTVIQNDSWNISIVGSANYTNNPRIEAGVISTDPAVASFHLQWMSGVLLNSKPFEEA